MDLCGCATRTIDYYDLFSITIFQILVHARTYLLAVFMNMVCLKSDLWTLCQSNLVTSQGTGCFTIPVM